MSSPGGVAFVTADRPTITVHGDLLLVGGTTTGGATCPALADMRDVDIGNQSQATYIYTSTAR